VTDRANGEKQSKQRRVNMKSMVKFVSLAKIIPDLALIRDSKAHGGVSAQGIRPLPIEGAGWGFNFEMRPVLGQSGWRHQEKKGTNGKAY
jgi:hypothetical protein